MNCAPTGNWWPKISGNVIIADRHILNIAVPLSAPICRESVEEVLAERRVEWQKKGLAINNVDFENDSFHFAVRYPLRPGVLSYSLDGKAVAVPMGDHKDFDAGVLGLVVYPNFWMDAVSDYMWTMRVTAVSPSITILILPGWWIEMP